MSRNIYCSKLKKELEGLESMPLPGELGKRIYDEISKEAWQQWLDRQTILINEYRLSLLDPKSREFLIQEMEKFLFSEDATFSVDALPRQDKNLEEEA